MTVVQIREKILDAVQARCGCATHEVELGPLMTALQQAAAAEERRVITSMIKAWTGDTVEGRDLLEIVQLRAQDRK